MKRKDIRKVLKRWVHRNDTGYNDLRHTFLNIGLDGTRMSKEFESLVDEVYNMAQENNEKERNNNK